MDAAGVEPAMPEAAGLQPAGVTNFPTHPIQQLYWYSVGDLNPFIIGTAYGNQTHLVTVKG